MAHCDLPNIIEVEATEIYKNFKKVLYQQVYTYRHLLYHAGNTMAITHLPSTALWELAENPYAITSDDVWDLQVCCKNGFLVIKAEKGEGKAEYPFLRPHLIGLFPKMYTKQLIELLLPDYIVCVNGNETYDNMGLNNIFTGPNRRNIIHFPNTPYQIYGDCEVPNDLYLEHLEAYQYYVQPQLYEKMKEHLNCVEIFSRNLANDDIISDVSYILNEKLFEERFSFDFNIDNPYEEKDVSSSKKRKEKEGEDSSCKKIKTKEEDV
jgi:hypothetical protein